MTRRDVMLAAGTLTMAEVVPAAVGAQTAPAAAPKPALPTRFPDKASFFPSDLVYLDNGSQHPISTGAKAAVDTYLSKRMLDPAAARYDLPDDGVREKFARLVNADADDIAYVQSTTAGEQMVLRGLGLPQSGGHIVTDTLHFFGSLPLYEEMQRRGVEVTWVEPKDGRILLSDLKQAIRKDTRLVALSLVSTINGFEHDLKAVCDLAHAQGALVYADIIHAAGCVPVDLKGSGVDFAACASYKWLMGDFGLGFVYGTKAARAQLARTEYGYYGMSAFKPHIYPFDPPGGMIADYAYADTAEGTFAHGTHAHTVIAQLDHSLDYILGVGVPAIQAHAQDLIGRLKRELPKLGYSLMTPPESATPLVTCAYENARETLGPKLAAAKIKMTVSANRFRVTPSVFNDHTDIDRLLAALGHA
ncbi:aminotransferase class V-fold PLP-dependent enzyme [Nitrospirillum sp. BR 11164]|uniref:aminotransferase class V-fold PLP-dependent enzyme n=1 Tax=Nitrospirillum sp. BR 11164 TaxID=3104324 RepID=UPI002AFE5F2E|nr:aminotransferase class V-fold PLP-dependent enzyme [Nitrospirillum sp. BR 11164]MEA1648369.1 aminotransferase class V-fold PLP-dependent enzyme [Nitrospirillum sp. BR 11164]